MKRGFITEVFQIPSSFHMGGYFLIAHISDLGQDNDQASLCQILYITKHVFSRFITENNISQAGL